MNFTAPACFAAGLALALVLPAPAQDPGADMQEMMARMQRWTKPGENHQALQRFVGKWTTETRVHMGGQASPPEKGTAEFAWRIDGRWLEGTWKGSLMGMPSSGAMWLGYDNFKMSYVWSQISNHDTMLLHSEGDMTRDAKSLVMYGPLDEYLTGEHDKMVKYAWRFVSEDEMRFEVHDLPIGETGALVVDVVYKRVK
jgi:hypothetical protein